MHITIPVDGVIDVNNVIKGESVSYPQVVWNFGDNYIHVINLDFSNIPSEEVCFSAIVLLWLSQQEQGLNLREDTNC